MNTILSMVGRWFGFGSALAERSGEQQMGPAGRIVEDTVSTSPDTALQLATVYRCVDLLSKCIATLPFQAFVARPDGNRELARLSSLYNVLHDSPNRRHTPAELWLQLIPDLLLRGNCYCRIDRSATGEVIALWPMSADRVTPYLLDTGDVVYLYRLGGAETTVLAAEYVLHVRGMGGGVAGISMIEYMAATVTEGVRAQAQATRTFKNGNKPAGILTVDKPLPKEQRDAVRRNFREIAEGSESRIFVLEAGMKYEPTQLTPEDVQLLTTRQFNVEEICRWFGVPPVLVGHSNVTAWGSGIEQILDGFYKLTIRPFVVLIEQAVKKRVLTPVQRGSFTVEINLDALLRASLKDRIAIYCQATQNGIFTRNESRRWENLPPKTGGDHLTVQSNLVPIELLGKVPASAAPPADTGAGNNAAA